MSTVVTPVTPPKKTNRIGLEVMNYRGGKTTLCAGCGHNSISERVVECFYELGIEPTGVAKFSGIGLDGILLSWVDYLDGLARWQKDVMPRLEQAGLRRPAIV